MAANETQTSSHDDARTEFVNFLNREDIRRVNYEGKAFYRRQDITKWMGQARNIQDRGGSNAARLLYKVYSDKPGFQPIQENQISGHLLVFAILAHPDLECGHMIHIFKKYIQDTHLEMTDLSETYRHIIADLKRKGTLLPKGHPQNKGFVSVTSAFDQLRWAFSPASLDFDMCQSFPQGSCILPFCYSKPINNKGGTASVQMYRVQEDLIVSKPLRDALHSSRKRDPKFGRCYELAVKSYMPDCAGIYNMESQAFKGMRDVKGVVKYLGEYHLISSRSDEHTSTSHIMLEYAELDLDEYLAYTCPPILSEEVLTFWGGLFKVAQTIRLLHNLKHVGGDGSEQHFKGWHGDIKPDNILRVRGEYMLADFGFTKFEKDIAGRKTTYLLGGTRTYGAPECDTKARGGTLTPYSQTIDTWSFGCVLSAVATWVVLGSQAYENYGERRELAVRDLHQRAKNTTGGVSIPSCEDSFHDGQTVLPAVTEWHDYLRNSCRRADTITPLVLDLVDKEMLLSRPDERLTLEQLCEKLDDILVVARARYQRTIESGDLKKLTPKTLEALLKLDEDAPDLPEALSSSMTPSAPRGLSKKNDSHQLAPPPSRVRKSERFDKIVVAKTANRQGVIRDACGLGKSPVSALAGDGDVIHGSPEQQPLDSIERTPEILISTEELVSSPTAVSPVSALEGTGREELQGSSRSQNKSQTLHRIVTGTANTDEYHQDAEYYISNRHEHHSQPMPQKRLLSRNDQRETSPQSSPALEHNALPIAKSAEASHIYNSSKTAAELPAFSENHHSRQNLQGNGLSSDGISTSLENHHHTPVPVQDHDHRRNPRLDEVHKNPITPSASVQQSDPESAAIYEEYYHLKGEWAERRASTWHNFLRTRRVPEDARLKRFISNRDIIFIVDNAATMESHWAHVRTTLLALAMKIGTLDRDGLDLVFTVGDSCEKSNVKEWAIPAEFEDSMKRAEQEFTKGDLTDMAATLARVFDRYVDMTKKQTLLVLTDGLWDGVEDDVEQEIRRFVVEVRKRLMGKHEPRWFSIQFISFGHDTKALARLAALDDELHASEDIVDHTPWNISEVEKLILGSFIGTWDERPAQPSAHTALVSSQSPGPSQSDKHWLDRKPSKLKRLFGKDK